MYRGHSSLLVTASALSSLLTALSLASAQTPPVVDPATAAPPDGSSAANDPQGETSPAQQPLGPQVTQLAEDSFYFNDKRLLRDDRYRFELRMPAQPVSGDQRVRSKFGQIALRRHMLSNDATTFLVVHSEYPPEFFRAKNLDPVARPIELLEFTAQTFVRGRKGAKLLHRKEIKLGDRVGLEQAIVFPAGQSPDGKAYDAGVSFQRSFVREQGLDIVLVQFSKSAYEQHGEESRKTMILFLDSFHYLDDPVAE